MSQAPPVQGRIEGEDASSVTGNPASYELHPQAPTPQQRSGAAQPFAASGQQFPSSNSRASRAPGRGEGAFRMGNMAGALPDYPPSIHPYAQAQTPQRLPPGASSPALVYQLQQLSQFAGQTPGVASGYNISPFPSQFVQGQQGNPGPTQPPFAGSPYFPNQQQQFMVYQAPYGQVGQSPQGFQSRLGGYAPQLDRRLHDPHAPSQFRHQEGELRSPTGNLPHQIGFAPGAPVQFGYGPPFLQPEGVHGASRESSGSSPGSIPSAPRGPPRKPKQSGHALWVGNLPPGTRVIDLKDHFSRDATRDIESVFLISKSNCAFVNYRTEAACAAAMTRFHDSRFQGVRLVCRLRRSSNAPAPGVPTGPASLMPPVTQAQSASEAIAHNRETSTRAAEALGGNEKAPKSNEKFFIVKSLTVEDLELSARNGIWATQAHNEDALNKAYESVENVYLIFSANKSGEYFGYARMASPINDDAAANLKWTPRVETVSSDPELPRSIPTVATEFAPKGHIIDDSARGTIFWEADPEDQDIELAEEGDDTKSTKSVDEGEEASPAEAQVFGKPFKIAWQSTNRLPFYRTRGLRNPWNANREVKIARDGTELETSVGRRLVQMFHRSHQSPTGPQFQGIPMPMGYPPSRPY